MGGQAGEQVAPAERGHGSGWPRWHSIQVCAGTVRTQPRPAAAQLRGRGGPEVPGATTTLRLRPTFAQVGSSEAHWLYDTCTTGFWCPERSAYTNRAEGGWPENDDDV